MHWPASLRERQRRTICAFAVLAVGCLGTASESIAYGRSDPWLRIPDLLVGVVFIGSAVVAARRLDTALLLAGTAVAWFLANLDDRFLYLHRGLLIHAIVAYIGARAGTATERVAVVVGYAAAVFTGLWSVPSCAVVLSVGLVAVALHRLLSASGRLRGARRTALVASVVFSSAVVANAIARAVARDHSVSEPMLLLYELALCAVAVLLAAGVVAPSTSVVTNLMVELGEARSGMLRDALAHVLRDPSLEVGYHSIETGDYRDESGRAMSVPPTVGERAATFVERESRPFAVLVHDASVLEEPALVDAVATATRLSTANTALTAELRGQIGHAAAARRRLMLADVEERRRLERRLHDGVERRLVEMTAQLRSFVAGDSVRGHLDRADQHLLATLTDLGQLARGLHPRELSLGLVAAVQGLIGRTPLPIELHVEVEHAPPEEIAAAAYFVCAEGLSNVVKHADAEHVRVEVEESDVALIVTIVDDGRGGADPMLGSGLRGLSDRVSSLGGSVTVSSRSQSGTRLTARLPLGPGDG